MNVRGLAALTANASLTPYTFTRRDLGPSDVAVAIKYAGICHSDIHQVKEEWGGAIFPMVPGHEISGVVSAVGAAVSKFQVGDLIYWKAHKHSLLWLNLRLRFVSEVYQ